MLKKVTFILIVLFLLLVTPCFAENEKLAKNMTEQEFVDKYFAGRTLDPIEGIWFQGERYDKKTVAIVKTTFITPDNPKYSKYDYLIIILDIGDHSGEFCTGLIPIRNPFLFKGNHTDRSFGGSWRLLSLTALVYNFDFEWTEFYTRIYPTQ